VMPAWYDILGPGRPEDAAGLRASRLLVDALIEREVARGVPASRIVLAGFSQGCAMTFMTGLRHGQRLAGLLGMSGYLPLAELTGAERSAANADVPIFQAHGSADEMIPIARATWSRDALIALGYAVEWHAYPMAHSVCPQEIADMNHWLLRVLT
jgi:phospholipase/carboxylesterase